MSNVRDLTGSIVALVTPFKANGDVDFEALDRLVDFHLANVQSRKLYVLHYQLLCPILILELLL